jgi:dGTPase
MPKKPFSQIIQNNIVREAQLSPYACPSNKGLRKNPTLEKIPDHANIRPIFFHDTDKIIHSSAYARYIDKTQVFFLFQNDHITHRVLHVQFVSKIGRVIGRALKLNEDLIEAISLGHDIGHTPYGHDGEKILNKICQEQNIGNFAHNAQSVKFLNEIENHQTGLNLSLQVLDGILCHNGEILSHKYQPYYQKTWSIFEQEYQACFSQNNYQKHLIPMTLEGCVVRIADIIAYIGRDIEDAITLKLIKRQQIPRSISKFLGNSNDKIINTITLDLINNSYQKKHLEFSVDVFKALQDLKQFNFNQIYFNPKIKTENAKINNMFYNIYNFLSSDYEKHAQHSYFHNLFLKNLNSKSSYYKNTPYQRQIIDCISGMTDKFFNAQFHKIFFPKNFGYHL